MPYAPLVFRERGRRKSPVCVAHDTVGLAMKRTRGIGERSLEGPDDSARAQAFADLDVRTDLDAQRKPSPSDRPSIRASAPTRIVSAAASPRCLPRLRRTPFIVAATRKRPLAGTGHDQLSIHSL